MRYVAHLSRDPRLKKLIADQGPLRLTRRGEVCFMLCSSVMSQQLGTKVARTIRQRFLQLYDGGIPAPETILETPARRLRAIGLSNAKASYIHNVARFALEEGLDKRKLGRMSDDEVVEYLTRIKGVGRWTAEMSLMFTLGREDVFSAGDGGIRSAMQKLYRLDRYTGRKLDERLHAIAARWKPYRTYACMHLWRYKDDVTPVTGKSAGKAT